MTKAGWCMCLTGILYAGCYVLSLMVRHGPLLAALWLLDTLFLLLALFHVIREARRA